MVRQVARVRVGQVKTKICGITNYEDAEAVVAAGCDAAGFVFYKGSPRYISPEEARKIIRKMPAHIIKVGVFVNEKEELIRQIAEDCKLDMLQFHGNESKEFCKKFKNYRVIKSFRIKKRKDLKSILDYNVFAYLFDTFDKNKIGGTGKKFDWKLIRHIDGIRRPVFLSGGLSEKNIKKAISSVHPDWVDVSSSVEVKPGIKDHLKVKGFIEAVKNAKRS